MNFIFLILLINLILLSSTHLYVMIIVNLLLTISHLSIQNQSILKMFKKETYLYLFILICSVLILFMSKYEFIRYSKVIEIISSSFLLGYVCYLFHMVILKKTPYLSISILLGLTWISLDFIYKGHRYDSALPLQQTDLFLSYGFHFSNAFKIFSLIFIFLMMFGFISQSTQSNHLKSNHLKSNHLKKLIYRFSLIIFFCLALSVPMIYFVNIPPIHPPSPPPSPNPQPPPPSNQEIARLVLLDRFNISDKLSALFLQKNELNISANLKMMSEPYDLSKEIDHTLDLSKIKVVQSKIFYKNQKDQFNLYRSVKQPEIIKSSGTYEKAQLFYSQFIPYTNAFDSIDIEIKFQSEKWTEAELLSYSQIQFSEDQNQMIKELFKTETDRIPKEYENRQFLKISLILEWFKNHFVYSSDHSMIGFKDQKIENIEISSYLSEISKFRNDPTQEIIGDELDQTILFLIFLKFFKVPCRMLEGYSIPILKNANENTHIISNAHHSYWVDLFDPTYGWIPRLIQPKRIIKKETPPPPPIEDLLSNPELDLSEETQNQSHQKEAITILIMILSLILFYVLFCMTITLWIFCKPLWTKNKFDQYQAICLMLRLFKQERKYGESILSWTQRLDIQSISFKQNIIDLMLAFDQSTKETRLHSKSQEAIRYHSFFKVAMLQLLKILFSLKFKSLLNFYTFISIDQPNPNHQSSTRTT